MSQRNSYQIMLITIIILFTINIGENYYIYNKNKETLNTHTTKIEELNSTIQNINENMIHVINRIDDLKTKTDELSSNEVASSYIMDNLVNNIDDIDDRIYDIENEIGIIEKRTLESIQKVSDLKDHVSELYNEIGVKQGNKLYLENKIWFEYNETLEPETGGILGNEASLTDGFIQFDLSKNELINIISFAWQYDYQNIYNLDSTSIDDEMDAILLKEGLDHFEILESETIEYNDHQVSVNSYSGDLYGESFFCKIAYWNCEHNHRNHSTVILSNHIEELTDLFETYFYEFICHK